jgi:DNA adenine methylase
VYPVGNWAFRLLEVAMSRSSKVDLEAPTLFDWRPERRSQGDWRLLGAGTKTPGATPGTVLASREEVCMTTVTAQEPLPSFLKWAGGKSRTARLLAELAPTEGYKTYREPFCGSAAVFFALRPDRAVLSDANEDLVVCLQQVAAEPEAVMSLLDKWPNERPFFEDVRRWDVLALSPTERAARVIYLNKTSFRGLWRVNRKGGFNTPYGEYDRPYYNRATLLAASAALKGMEVRAGGFQEMTAEAEAGDWIYLDPPYVPDRKWGDFTRYTPGQFGPEDQDELVAICRELDVRGVRWLLTNSDTEITRDLYSAFEIRTIPTRRDIALQSSDRNSVDLVVSNYILPWSERLPR